MSSHTPVSTIWLVLINLIFLCWPAIDMSTFEALKLTYLRSTGLEEPGVLALLAFGSVSGSIGATVSKYSQNFSMLATKYGNRAFILSILFELGFKLQAHRVIHKHTLVSGTLFDRHKLVMGFEDFIAGYSLHWPKYAHFFQSGRKIY